VKIIGIVTINIDKADIRKAFLLDSSFRYFFTNKDVISPSKPNSAFKFPKLDSEPKVKNIINVTVVSNPPLNPIPSKKTIL